MIQGAAIDELQFSADRHAMSDAADDKLEALDLLSDVIGSCLAFHCRIAGQDDLTDPAFSETRQQLGNAQLIRPDSIDRRQMSHENEIYPPVPAHLFNGVHIRR